MASTKILVVEDDAPIREMISFGLRRARFEVREAGDCRSAQAELFERRPDLLLVDWMLPDMSGVDLTRSLRRDRTTSALPIIMLTARGEEQDRIAGLDSGADDYITKPFSPRELLARINALLRRSTSGHADEEVIGAASLTLNPATHRVTVGDRTVPLGPTEYRLLNFFLTNQERVYSRNQLLDHMWAGIQVEERTIDVHIRRLRKALDDFGCDQFIQTVRGIGYRFSTRND